jgi:hypothetical protein
VAEEIVKPPPKLIWFNHALCLFAALAEINLAPGLALILSPHRAPMEAGSHKRTGGSGPVRAGDPGLGKTPALLVTHSRPSTYETRARQARSVEHGYEYNC